MDLNALKLFVRVADVLSFTQAAQALGLTQSGVSRAVARLEDELRVKLINRNTHAVSLTPDGLYLYDMARRLIGELDDVGQRLNGRALSPEGELRITTPSAYGRLVTLPLLKTILDRYPALKIDAVMTDRLVDVVEEGFDAAIRIGHLTDSRLIGRTIRHLKFTTVASPAYLRKHGAPAVPDDLLQHNCLVVKGAGTGRRTKWRYRLGERVQHLDVSGNMTVDTADALLEAALCGIGIVQIMDFAVARYVESGHLVDVLPDFAVADIPLTLLYAKSRHRSPKIAALLAAFGLAG